MMSAIYQYNMKYYRITGRYKFDEPVMLEEYLVPLICIAFIAGVVIGINLAMLCSQRFSSKQQIPPAYVNWNTGNTTSAPTANFQNAPMAYPSGYLQHPNYSRHQMSTTQELTASDFTYGRKPQQSRRRQQSGLNYD